MQVSYELQGAREAGIRFEQFPEIARQKLEARITDLTERLYAAVEGAEPDRTGKLRGSTTDVVREGQNYITGRVSIRSDFGKAAALEYGAHKPTQVKAHAMRLSHFWSRAVAPLEVMVRAYTRTPNIAEHRFLRGPFDAMRGEIEAELEAALSDAVAEGA